MSETDILIVRHPETEANVAGRFVGQGESAYTELGRVQARRLPRKLARFQPEVVWSSPLLRARVVAERAARLAGVPLRIDGRLMEMNFGVAESLTWEELAEADIPFNYKSAEQPVAPGGESRNQLDTRVAAVLDEIHSLSGRHVVVCHGGVMRAALVHVLGLEPEQIWAFSIHNAQMAHVRIVGDHGLLEEYVRG